MAGGDRDTRAAGAAEHDPPCSAESPPCCPHTKTFVVADPLRAPRDPDNASPQGRCDPQSSTARGHDAPVVAGSDSASVRREGPLTVGAPGRPTRASRVPVSLAAARASSGFRRVVWPWVRASFRAVRGEADRTAIPLLVTVNGRRSRLRRGPKARMRSGISARPPRFRLHVRPAVERGRAPA